MGFSFHFSSLHSAPYIDCMCVSLFKFHIWILEQFYCCPKWPVLPRHIKLWVLFESFEALYMYISGITGKSLSDSLILGSTNPEYDEQLFIDLPFQYIKTTSSEHGENMLCAKIVLNVKTKTKNNFCAQHVLPMFWACSFHVLNW